MSKSTRPIFGPADRGRAPANRRHDSNGLYFASVVPRGLQKRRNCARLVDARLALPANMRPSVVLMREFNKVFVVALPRCATVSMSDALGAVGIATAHLGKIFGEDYPGHNHPQRLIRMYEQIVAGEERLDILEDCDGLADYPACCRSVIQMVDRAYPGSLFVNVQRRDRQKWLQSVERQFLGLQLLKAGRESTAEDRQFMDAVLHFRKLTFGQQEFDPQVYSAAYDEHQGWLSDYFSGRESDFLNIEDLKELQIQGFHQLCDFLGCTPVRGPFPRCNLHSEKPGRRFMQALESGEIVSQTGILAEAADAERQ